MIPTIQITCIKCFWGGWSCSSGTGTKNAGNCTSQAHFELFNSSTKCWRQHRYQLFCSFSFNIPGCVSINMQSVQGRNHMDLGMSLGALAQIFFQNMLLLLQFSEKNLQKYARCSNNYKIIPHCKILPHPITLPGSTPK